MKLNINKWFVAALLFAPLLGSCAIDNKLVIKNNEGVPNVYTIKGYKMVLIESKVRFTPLYGAAWDLSGNLAALVNRTVVKLNSNQDITLPKSTDAQIQLQNIIIRFGDRMTDGSHTRPFLSLEMEMGMTDEGRQVRLCQVPSIHPGVDQPIYHGLFAGREKIRSLLLPVYEDMITRALYDGLVVGLNCLFPPEQ